MNLLAYFKIPLIVFVFLMTSSCVMYTESQSESLSRSVYATSDSIQKARFDLAHKYSKQAERIVRPPKERININEIITEETTSVSSVNTAVPVNSKAPSKPGSVIASSVITTTSNNSQKTMTLRLVVPEHLRHAKLLVENSEEWKELIKTKKFSEQLEQDNKNLKELANKIDKDLQEQLKINNQLIVELNDARVKLVKKDLAILQRNIAIVVLIGLIGGGIYLRIKGIL